MPTQDSREQIKSFCEKAQRGFLASLMAERPGITNIDCFIAPERCSPLFLAAEAGHLDAVRYLLNQGASVDFQNEHGETPLQIACANGHVAVIQLLLEHGANLQHAVDGVTPLSIACENGHLDAVKLLLGQGATLEAAPDGPTPLIAACSSGQLEVMAHLLQEYNTDPTLWRHSKASHTTVQQAIAESKLPDSMTDAPVATSDLALTVSPLSAAAMSGNVEAVKLLLQHDNSLIDATTQIELLHIAAHIGSIPLLTYLQQKGAPIHLHLERLNQFADSPCVLSKTPKNSSAIQQFLRVAAKSTHSTQTVFSPGIEAKPAPTELSPTA